MKKKVALITGIGQDASWLAHFLLEKKYEVYLGVRRAADRDYFNLDYLGIRNKVQIVPLDLLDYSNIRQQIKTIMPDELYNLAAMSFVQTSFVQPISMTQINALGVAFILDILHDISPKTRFYQASSSEMFGASKPSQNENTPFHPRSPYGIAKLYAYWMTRNYREAYQMHCSNGILFNHESELRGDEFVTKKIVNYVARYFANDKIEALEMGNLNSKRDWGYAKDYVEAMWQMLQKPLGGDYVICTGKSHSVREFVELAFKRIGVEIVWKGGGDMHELGINKATKRVCVRVIPKFYRPAEVDDLRGDPENALKKLGWQSKTTLEELVNTMVDFEVDLNASRRLQL